MFMTYPAIVKEIGANWIEVTFVTIHVIRPVVTIGYRAKRNVSAILIKKKKNHDKIVKEVGQYICQY